MVDYTKRENRMPGASAPAAGVAYDQGLRSYMLKVYNHMGLGLAVTGLVAFFTASSPALLQAIYGSGLMWVLMIAEFAMVWYLSARVFSMSEGAGRAWFYAYAAANGLTFSVIFIAYTMHSIAQVFFITAGMFGAMSLYGYTTKKDLTGMGQFLMMGLFGLIIASLVNIFLKSPGLYWATSYLGVVIFVGLTAYDVQKVKHTYHVVGQQNVGKAATLGALSLYLDFINLMIMLLRIMGDRR